MHHSASCAATGQVAGGPVPPILQRDAGSLASQSFPALSPPHLHKALLKYYAASAAAAAAAAAAASFNDGSKMDTAAQQQALDGRARAASAALPEMKHAGLRNKFHKGKGGC